MSRFLLFPLIAVFLLGTAFIPSGDKGYVKKIKKHRKKVHREFKNPEKSPLKEKAKDFEGLDFFPPDATYRFEADFRKTPEATPFEMPTSNPKIQKKYVKYGILTFSLQGKKYELSVYRSLRLAGMKKYKDYLFLPFKDYTNGDETYGGGRYLDMKMPEGNKVIIDFNLCYNPYCAYSDGWSCPIPPEENHLPVAIKAGVKAYEVH